MKTENAPYSAVRSLVETRSQTRTRPASRPAPGEARFEQLLGSRTASRTATTTNSRPVTTPAVTTPAPTTQAATAPAATSNTGQIAASVPPSSQVANVFGLMTPNPIGPAALAASVPPGEDTPTAESVFGANPWMSSPGGLTSNGGAFYYNPQYFATRETADKVAQLLGGKVVTRNAMTGEGGPFNQTQPNFMVELPNGRVVNPGLTATYYTHGWPQSYIDRMLQLDRG